AIVFDDDLNDFVFGFGVDTQAMGLRTLLHGLNGVGDKVINDLLELVRISVGFGEIWRKVEREADFEPVQVKLPQLGNALNDVVEIDHLAFWRLFAGKGEEIANKFSGASAFVGNFLEVTAGLGRKFVMSENQFQITFNNGKRIVQFVGDAGDHLAEGRKFF